MNIKRHIYRLANPIRRLYWFLFRPKTLGVKVILEYQNQYLMVRHSYGKSYWTFPGGGIHRNESPVHAAEREIQEEVGIRISSPNQIGSYTTKFEYKRDLVYCFHAKIDTSIFTIDTSELLEAKWFPKNQLPENLSPAVLKILKLIDN